MCARTRVRENEGGVGWGGVGWVHLCGSQLVGALSRRALFCFAVAASSAARRGREVSASLSLTGLLTAACCLGLLARGCSAPVSTANDRRLYGMVVMQRKRGMHRAPAYVTTGAPRWQWAWAWAPHVCAPTTHTHTHTHTRLHARASSVDRVPWCQMHVRMCMQMRRFARN